VNQNLIKSTLTEKILELPHVDDTCNYYESTLPSSDRIFRQAVAKVKPDDDINVIFNLPIESSTCFITVSDGDPTLIRGLLSNLEQCEINGDRIKKNDVLRYESQELKDNGVCALVLLPISVSGVLSELDETLEIAGRLYTFHLVVFVSEQEYTLWKHSGMKALASHFDEIDKDLISFKQVNISTH